MPLTHNKQFDFPVEYYERKPSIHRNHNSRIEDLCLY